MSTDIYHYQNLQVREILRLALNELRWGDYSDMKRVDVFEVWTIRDDGEIDRVGAHVEYVEAVASSQLLVLIMQAGAAAEIVATVVVWIFRDSVEDSVLEIGTEKRAG
jgi:hypothetical protein